MGRVGSFINAINDVMDISPVIVYYWCTEEMFGTKQTNLNHFQIEFVLVPAF